MVVHTLWSAGIPMEYKIFLWKVLMGALPTTAKLTSMNFQLGLCQACHTSSETIPHLFGYCVLLAASWKKYLRMLEGLLGCSVNKTQVLIAFLGVPSDAQAYTFMVFRYHLLRHIWLARNMSVFNSCSNSMDVIEVIKGAAAEWVLFFEAKSVNGGLSHNWVLIRQRVCSLAIG